MPNIPWGEVFVGTAPGIPLSEGTRSTPGIAIPEDGYLVPSDAPGFGIEFTLDDLEQAAI